MFCRRTFLNPCSSALTSYRPADRLGNVKNPVASLTAVRGIWVAVAVTVTVAPGTTAPCASLMVPEICPRSSWAAAGAATPSAHATTRAQRRTTRAEKYIYVLLLVPLTRYAWPETTTGLPPCQGTLSRAGRLARPFGAGLLNELILLLHQRR